MNKCRNGKLCLKNNVLVQNLITLVGPACSKADCEMNNFHKVLSENNLDAYQARRIKIWEKCGDLYPGFYLWNADILSVKLILEILPGSGGTSKHSTKHHVPKAKSIG